MKTTWMALLTVSLAALCARQAHAHGGSFWHGPPPDMRAPSIPCDCAKVSCELCSTNDLEKGGGLAVRETTVEIVERWGDVGRIRVTSTFVAAEGAGPQEAYARIEHAPLLAVISGVVRQGENELKGALAASGEARRKYLWVRNRTLRDPLLVLPQGPGVVGLRAFPVLPGKKTVVTLEAFVLLDAPDLEGERLYRTGTSCLIVRPLDDASTKGADFVDPTGRRALEFLDEWPCRRRHAALFEDVVDVPFVRALGDVVRGDGGAAVGEDKALVALEAGARVPQDLFVGPASKAPRIGPPGLFRLREPSDPTPPPPPPKPVETTADGSST